jgi:hypothetical protein
MPFDGGVFTDQAAWRAALPSKIRIVNPTPGGDRFTSLHKAQDYVRRGCARLSACGTRLRFVETHHVTRSAELTAKELADQAWRLSARGYDARGLLRLDEIARLPCIRPVVLVTKRRSG